MPSTTWVSRLKRLSRPLLWSSPRVTVPLGSTHGRSSSLTWSDRRRTPEAPGLKGRPSRKPTCPQRRRRKRKMAWRDTALISLPATASRSAVVSGRTRDHESKSTLLSGLSEFTLACYFHVFVLHVLKKSGAWKGSSTAVLPCRPPASLLCSTTRPGPPSSGQSTASCTRLLPSYSKRLSWWTMPVLQVCTIQTMLRAYLELLWQENAAHLQVMTLKARNAAQYCHVNQAYLYTN